MGIINPAEEQKFTLEDENGEQLAEVWAEDFEEAQRKVEQYHREQKIMEQADA